VGLRIRQQQQQQQQQHPRQAHARNCQ
jgi:hypothetical protein